MNIESRTEIKVYETLPQEAMKIRQAVFVKEQGFFDEFDKVDQEAKHMLLFIKETPVATCRFFRKDLNSGDYVIGRFAVIKKYRGQNIGSRLLKAAEIEIAKAGGKCVFLHAQDRVRNFYEKQGYLPYGGIEFEEGCPHIWMSKKIGNG